MHQHMTRTTVNRQPESNGAEISYMLYVYPWGLEAGGCDVPTAVSSLLAADSVEKVGHSFRSGKHASVIEIAAFG